MAKETPCQTPGTNFTTIFAGNQIIITVELPWGMGFSEEQAKLAEANIHNALELVLARYFREDEG